MNKNTIIKLVLMISFKLVVSIIPILGILFYAFKLDGLDSSVQEITNRTEELKWIANDMFYNSMLIIWFIILLLIWHRK